MPRLFKPQKVNGSDTALLVQGRVSYEHIMTAAAPQNNPNADKVYSCALLIDKNDTETVKAIEAAIAAATVAGKEKKWGGTVPRKLATPLTDGDDQEREEYAGMVYFNCKSKRRPGVMGRDKQPITDPEEVYSGMWAILSVNFYPYSVTGNNGVGVGLNAVLKVADGEPLGGGGDGTGAFSGVTLAEMDDYDDDAEE